MYSVTLSCFFSQNSHFQSEHRIFSIWSKWPLEKRSTNSDEASLRIWTRRYFRKFWISWLFYKKATSQRLWGVIAYRWTFRPSSKCYRTCGTWRMRMKRSVNLDFYSNLATKYQPTAANPYQKMMHAVDFFAQPTDIPLHRDLQIVYWPLIRHMTN